MKRATIQFKLPIVFISFLFLVICSSNAYGSRADVEAFVTRFYQECLGRTPGSNSLNNWTNYLLNGEKTGAEVAYGFAFSPEFLGMNTTDEEFLYVLYEAFFDRQPDQAGYDRWLSELSSQTPIVGLIAARKNVLNGFLGAPEFKNLCDEYGITRGTVTYIRPSDDDNESEPDETDDNESEPDETDDNEPDTDETDDNAVVPTSEISAWSLSSYADAVYLGCWSCGQYDSNSIHNKYSSYGSKYSATSIRNSYSSYGSQYSSDSACSSYASNPPELYDSTYYYGQLSVNAYALDGICNSYSWAYSVTNCLQLQFYCSD